MTMMIFFLFMTMPIIPIAKMIAVPGLVLQGLTTRKPDPDQIEVAIVAMQEAISHDEMQESARQHLS